MTTPENDLARKAAENPKSLSQAEYDIWYCTAYVGSIAFQIEEVIPGSVARPVRQIAESEGKILDKTQLLMLLITVLSLLSSALGVSNLISANVMERSRELGLLKALGASNLAVSLLVLAELFAAGLVGGVAGYFAGLGFAQLIGETVFGSGIAVNLLVIPVVAVLLTLVLLGGSIPAKDKRSGKVEEVGSSVARQTFFTRRRIQPRKMSPRKHNSTHIAIHTPRSP